MTEPLAPQGDVTAITARVLVVGPYDLSGVLDATAAVEVERVALLGRLTAQVMDRFRPDLVLSPLLAPRFDILDVAARLEAFGFSGKLCAVTAPLPDAEAVTSEVRGQFRNLDFSLVIRADGGAGISD